MEEENRIPMDRSGNQAEDRKKSYKSGFDTDESRRRQLNAIVIRENMRNDDLSNMPVELDLISQLDKQNDQEIEQNRKLLEGLPSMVDGVRSGDVNAQLHATCQLGKLLSTGPCPPIDEVVNAGILDTLVRFLGKDEFQQLQDEAAWVLTNIVLKGTSEQRGSVISNNAIPMFVRLLGSASTAPGRDKGVLWALGKIAADAQRCRDLVLDHGALPPLLSLLNENTEISVLRAATWTLCFFCRPLSDAQFAQVKAALPLIQPLLYLDDERVLRYACRALYYLYARPGYEGQTITEGVCQRIIVLLSHSSLAVSAPAVMTAEYILSGSYMQTQFFINSGVLDGLDYVLNSNHESLIKVAACRAISSITAWNMSTIQAVIDSNLVASLIHLIRNGGIDIKREATTAIANATCGSLDQIQFLVEQGCISALCGLLTCPDNRAECLRGLRNILKVGVKLNGVSLYAPMFVQQSGAVELIMNLRTRDNASGMADQSAAEMISMYTDDIRRILSHR